MNKFLLFLTALGLSPLTSMGQIAVGTSNPEPSAAFEVYSKTKGFLPPRMTESQMLAIPSPLGGLLIYCTNCIDKGVYIYHDLEFLNMVTGRSGHAEIVNTFVEASSNPAADGTPSLAELTNIGITGITESQTYYEEAIADASPTPNTLEELQAIIQNANIALPPVITSDPTVNDLDENSGAGQNVYTVTACDYLGIDSYAISGTDASAFTIDPSTGVVTLTDNPDFETQESYTFEVTASDAAGNSSAPKNVTLSITDLDDEAPVITSPATANTISVNSGAGQEIYTVTASDNVGVTSYAIGGTDASAFTIDQTTGEITITDPNFDIENFYTFKVTVSDFSNNPKSLIVSINNEEGFVTWGQTRYIMFRGTDENGLYNNIGELDILDSLGINLIDNGVLDKNNFTYRYGGGYYTNSPGSDLFNNTPSNNYANNEFSVNEAQKWVLIDLNQTVEIGALRIQARSNSSSHIDRITHLTVFTSNRNDTGFSYSGVENTNNKNENLILEKNLDQMKSDPTLLYP